MCKLLVIAGTQSGVGKTTLTVGLVAALRRRGLIVQPFKVGPDYIDPTYHALAASRSCRNLDTWMIPPERIRALFDEAVLGADVAIIEGVMGLYDGSGYEDETGSTAQVAKLLAAPVILVLEASKIARSAAALAAGYQRFDADLPLVGFIVNRVGSESHGAGVSSAIEKATGLLVFGWLPREERLQVPERHLGLVPTAEPGAWQDFVEAACELVTRHLDLDRMLAIAPDSLSSRARPSGTPGRLVKPPAAGPVIAVARDEAFHFTYEENLQLLRAAGATVTFFSPLRDESLPPKTAGIVLGGGFPEIHAAQLSANHRMREAIRKADSQGLPIYAECGGLMYLTQSIVDLENREYPMAGLLPGLSVMSGRLTLGYRLARAAAASWLLDQGETVRGHEFHYSIWDDRPPDLPPAYLLLPPTGGGKERPEGACRGNVWASYVHVHFWSKPELADRFVAACREPVLRAATVTGTN